MTTEIKLDTRELDKIAKQLNIRKEAVGRRMAFQIEKRAKQLAPHKYGALRNSIYTVTQKIDGYASAAGKAMGTNWKQRGRVTETEPHPTPSGNVIANVGPCVEYAEYQEFGTSKMAAHPYLIPAVEEISRKYNDGSEWAELVK